MTKHIPVNKEELGLHVSYLYNRRNDYHLNGIARRDNLFPFHVI